MPAERGYRAKVILRTKGEEGLPHRACCSDVVREPNLSCVKKGDNKLNKRKTKTTPLTQDDDSGSELRVFPTRVT